MLLQDLLPLTFAATLFLSSSSILEHGGEAIAGQLEQRAEEPAERELRGKDDREKQQGQDQDDRTGLVEVLVEEGR